MKSSDPGIVVVRLAFVLHPLMAEIYQLTVGTPEEVTNDSISSMSFSGLPVLRGKEMIHALASRVLGI